MPRVKNRRVSAVGGWKYFQPQTGASFEDWDFGSIVQKIQQHRQGNPRFRLSTNLTDIENEVDEHNAMRMLSIAGAEGYVEASVGDSPPLHRPLNPPSSPSVAAGSSRVIGGAKIALEMFGSQGPVSAALAEHRASICVDCPKNDKGDWTKWFTVPASAVIRQMIGLIHDMKLTTPYDDKIQFCSACSCPIRSKVWAPLNHIKQHTPPEALEHVDERCWIIHESE